jgi:chemotaxis protein MotB
MAKNDDDKRPIIIIKRIKKVEGGHHGGAWKVAYADFVTAMMSFFLLLWLLNVTTDEQKMLISSYFAPADPRVATSTSGAGGVMGGTSLSPEGAMTSEKSPLMAMQQDPAEGIGREDGEDSDKKNSNTESLTEEQIEAAKAHAEQRVTEKQDKEDAKAFGDAQEQFKKAIEDQPDLRDLKQNLLVDMTPEGLRIQIVDTEGKPMFALGSAKPMPEAEKLFALVQKVMQPLPNKVSIRGHTDAKPYGKDAVYTNWELSADRANAARRSFLNNGFDVTRIENVQGKADRELLVENDPQSARNRRISIILLKQSVAKVQQKQAQAIVPPPVKPTKKGPDIKKHDPGVLYFP